MSRKKLLHELLREDQEPFFLKNYIADVRRRLKKPSSTKSQVLKSETFTRLRSNFCGGALRFVLRNNHSSDCRTPEFSPPTTSPSRQKEKDKVIYSVESLNNLQVEEGDKEQCSPVSTLDPTFEDDEGVNDGDDLDRSSSTVENGKPHPQSKLSRFEKLVELVPVELEKKMDDVLSVDISTADKPNMGKFFAKRRISDSFSGAGRHSTVEMMVERDLKLENGKKVNEGAIRETAMDVELAILAFLVEELAIEQEC